METEKSGLLANLFDKKTVEILKKLLLKKDIFYLRDLSRDSQVSLATTHRIIQKLVSLGLVTKQQQDKFTFYKILRDAPIYQEISNLIFGNIEEPAQVIKKELRDAFGPTLKVYQGRDKDKKIFVVSEQAKQANVDEITSKIYEQTGMKPTAMVITPAFFEQMHIMGLISKEKLVAI